MTDVQERARNDVQSHARPDLSQIRKLRFPNALQVGESIPGFLARCAADHPQPRLAPIYQEIGYTDVSGGKLQLAGREIIERLAAVTRSAVKPLLKVAGTRPYVKQVRFGDLWFLRAVSSSGKGASRR